MTIDKSVEQQLGSKLADLERFPNIWATAPVEVEPEKWIDCWRVFKVVKTNLTGFEDSFGLHFVGRNTVENNGAVSSKIENFDPISMCGNTRSGRIYQLTGQPGFSDDAQYVFNKWCRINQVEVEDATQDFIQRFNLSVSR